MEIATYDRWQVCDRRVITVEGQQRMEQLFGLQRAGLVRGVGGMFVPNPRINYEFCS